MAGKVCIGGVSMSPSVKRSNMPTDAEIERAITSYGNWTPEMHDMVLTLVRYLKEARAEAASWKATAEELEQRNVNQSLVARWQMRAEAAEQSLKEARETLRLAFGQIDPWIQEGFLQHPRCRYCGQLADVTRNDSGHAPRCDFEKCRRALGL